MTNRLRRFLAVVMIAAVFLVGANSAGASCALDPQIAAQQAVIVQLQAQKVGADARTAAVLDAHIAARQQAVIDLQAQCV